MSPPLLRGEARQARGQVRHGFRRPPLSCIATRVTCGVFIPWMVPRLFMGSGSETRTSTHGGGALRPPIYFYPLVRRLK